MGSDAPSEKGPALSGVPEIRTFQLDAEGVGSVRNSVNMFRGTVNLPVNLLSLPGRNGLDVNVQAFYEGNVHSQTDAWNLEAPTGVLGLGWFLPNDQIVVDIHNTGSPHDNDYYLIVGGSATPMICTFIDNIGVLHFQLFNYQFWKVQYDPTSETWTVVRDNGLTYLFGGKNSGRNTVQWGVKWGNWIGSTAATVGQQRFAVAWNLSELKNQWGESTRYEYCNVEQSVAGGLTYTKASYLKAITDVLGRRVDFQYKPKLYGQAIPSGEIVFEYQDPHQVNLIPSTACSDQSYSTGAPDAYQSRYETLYLDHINVTDRSGGTLVTIRFGYDLINVSSYGSVDPLYPYLWKRCLSSVIQENRDGQAAPGLRLEYSGRGETYPGALKSVTYPDGGVATYVYSSTAIANSSRSLQIAAPAAGARPRVWFGSDYTVIAWYDAASSRLQINIYSWVGTWVASNPFFVSIPASQFNTLQVVPGSTYFFLTYQDIGPARQHAEVFQRDERDFGKWKQNVLPTMTLTSNDSPTLVAAGRDFIVFYNPNFSNLKFQGFYWSWRTRQWTNSLRLPTVPAGPGNQIAIAAANNFYTVCSYNSATDTAQFQLFFTDQTGIWRSGSSWAVTGLGVYEPPNGQFLFQWALGETFAAATYITSADPGVATYQLRIFQWDENFNVVSTAGYMPPRYTIDSAGGDFSFPFAAVRGSLIGSNQHQLRYAGGTPDNWKHADLPVGAATPVNHFAYGNDIGLVSSTSLGMTSDYYMTFNPNSADNVGPNSSGWGQPFNLQNTGQFPTAGLNFFTVGRNIYALQPSGNWSLQQLSMPGEVNPESVQNRGPGYIIYQDKTGQSSFFVLLKNGGARSFTQVPSQQVYTGQEGTVPGTMLAGLKSFITYPAGRSFDNPGSLTLYQITDDQIFGPVFTLQVSRIEVPASYPGDRNFYQSYVYDQAGVTLDPSAAGIAQYAKVKVVPGSKDGFVSGCGYSYNYFSNAVSTAGGVFYPVGWPYNYYRILNGLQLAQENYDSADRLISSNVNWWQIYTTAGVGSQLAGAYFRQVNAQSTLDGVNQTSQTEYDLSTGMVTKTIGADYDSEGSKRTLTSSYMYAWQVPEYQAGILALNLLDSVVQKTDRVEIEGNPIIFTTSVDVTTWKDWGGGRWAPHKTYRWKGPPEATPPKFDFKNWSGTNEPPASAGWLKTSEVLSMTAQGTIQESMTVSGEYGDRILTTGTLYDSSNLTPVAQFNITRKTADAAGSIYSEVTYYGFESYENPQGWRLEPGNQPLEPYLFSGDSHTGDQCFKLPGTPINPIGPQLTLRPSYQDQKFIFSAWVKTSPGFGADAGSARWSITFLRDGVQIGDPLIVPIDDTLGHWHYLEKQIDLAGFRAQHNIPPGVQLDVQILATNQKQPQLYALLDDVRFSQLLGTFAATVYEEGSWLVTATLGDNGQTMRSVYNSFQRKIATVGPSENVVDLSTIYFSRNGNRNSFSAADPNSELVIKAADGGIYDDFRDGQWQDLWIANNPAAWSVHDQALVHASGAPGSIDTVTLRGTQNDRNYGVRFQVVPPRAGAPALSESLGINVGGKAGVRWRPQGSSGVWELFSNGAGVVQNVSGPLAGEWVLVAISNSILFYADGRQLFAFTFQSDISGALEIFTGSANQVSYKTVVFFRSPRTTMTYKNGGGQTIQTQALDGANVTLAATTYDELARGAVRTRATRIENALLGFNLGFVTGFDWTTGVMQGQVSALNPADEGYPYARDRFEDSPDGRTIEQGLPGKTLAIDLRIPPTERRTLKYAYSSNSKNGFMNNLPAGKYFQKTTTNQNGTVSLAITDQLKLTVAQGTAMSGSGSGTQYLKSSAVYDAAGNQTMLSPPNYYAPPAGSNPADWVTAMSYDMFGRVIDKVTPDTGRTRFIYDEAGRIRFTLDANGAAQTPNVVLYYKYDILGRLIENGYLVQEWNEAELRQKAISDPEWPIASDTWQKKLTYDGDGSIPNLVGRLVQARINNGAGTREVVETFAYDISGNVTVKDLQVADFDNRVYRCGYSYNNLNNIVSILYPPQVLGGNEGLEVLYKYNELGLVTSIGDSRTSVDRYATLEYYPTGNLKQTSLNNGTVPVPQDLAYNPPGWPTRLSAAPFDETLKYTSGGYGGGGYYNGYVAQKTDTANWKVPAVPCASEFAYDNSGRLTVADSTGSQCAFAVKEEFSYDANGNFGAVSGVASQNYTYYAASNRVENTDGTGAQAYAYDYNGNVTRADERKLAAITYDPSTQRTRSVSVGGVNPAQVSFEYGSVDLRVLKTVNYSDGRISTKKLYVHGISTLPLVEISESGEVRAYVYGPGGLVAMLKNAALYFVIRDFLGSTRVVLDHSNAVVSAYDYTVFGDFIGGYGDAGIISYLYTGQEYDGETRLYNYKARMYDPTLRRFYAPDPATRSGSPYPYAYNNPLRYVDPTGELPILLLAVIISAIAGAIVGAVAGGLAIAATGAKGGEAAGIFFANFFSGLIVGALLPLLPAGGGALAAAFGIEEGTLLAIGIAGTVTVAGATALGAAQGALGNAVEGESAGQGATIGAITGAVSAFFSELGGEIGGRFVARATQTALRAAETRPLLQVSEAAVSSSFKKTYLYAALANVAGGAVGGVVGAVVQAPFTDEHPADIGINAFVGALFGLPGIAPLIGGPNRYWVNKLNSLQQALEHAANAGL